MVQERGGVDGAGALSSGRDGGSAVLGQEPVSQWEGCVGLVQGRGQLWGPSPERKFSPTVPFALREVGGKNKVCQCG